MVHEIEANGWLASDLASDSPQGGAGVLTAARAGVRQGSSCRGVAVGSRCLNWSTAMIPLTAWSEYAYEPQQRSGPSLCPSAALSASVGW